MKKKLIAVAVAGALGVPGVALAQASTVQIYGTMILNYNYLDQGNNRVKSDVINSHDANLGFKGEEALGGGMSAWFQCESTMDVSGQAASLTASSWCGRNSAFGIKGNFGNIYAGNWDTPMKIVMGNFRPFSTAGAYGVTQLWNSTQSDAANTGASFTRRQTNLISYATPSMSGFQGYAAYSSSNEATASTSASTATKPRLWSVGGQYMNGPLILGAGYENHRNYNASNSAAYTGGNDTGLSLGAAYTFMGTLKASAIWTRNQYELNTAAGNRDLKIDSWGIYADWAVQGPHRIRAGYTKSGSSSGNAGSLAAPINVGVSVANGGAGDTGSKLMSLQYAYHLSKRTEINFGYSKVANDNRARMALQTLGTANTGQDQSAWVLGTKHTF